MRLTGIGSGPVFPSCLIRDRGTSVTSSVAASYTSPQPGPWGRLGVMSTKRATVVVFNFDHDELPFEPHLSLFDRDVEESSWGDA